MDGGEKKKKENHLSLYLSNYKRDAQILQFARARARERFRATIRD